MLLVLLKEIDNAEMSDWTRNAVATLYPSVEQSHPFFPTLVVTREKLAELDIAQQEFATLTDSDLRTIATRIEAAFECDEFQDELMLQVLEFHTEQVLKEKHR